MYAVISDIHSNLEALVAVLSDIDAHGVEELICLGDVVGYGPNPAECVDLIRQRCTATVKGNHDAALIAGAHGFHLRAAQAIDWTRDMLQPGFFSGLQVKGRWQFLAQLPLRHQRGQDLFVHGSPRDETQEYLMAMDLDWNHEKYSEVFEGFERLLFTGHTHLPVVITDEFEALTPGQLGGVYHHPPGKKAIVNVGSVGQPRDHDPHACYVLVDDLTVTWRRVPYGVAATVDKIKSIPELHDSLGERLPLGR